MFKFLKKMKGQSTLEYAVLIIIVIGALLTIQVYIKRGIQGRLQSATDDIGDQYSIGNVNRRATTFVSSTSNEQDIGGRSRSELVGNETTTTTVNQIIINAEQEFWG